MGPRVGQYWGDVDARFVRVRMRAFVCILEHFRVGANGTSACAHSNSRAPDHGGRAAARHGSHIRLSGKSQRDRGRARGRDRHHRRSRLRLGALQDARLPAQRRSAPDLRRRARGRATRRPCSRRSPTIASAATFFPIGKHATYYPEILKQVAAAGHSVGTHTWSHKDLSRKPYSRPRTGQGRDREGHQRGALRTRAVRLRRSSAFPRSSIRRSSSPISASAISASSPPTSIRSTSRCASRKRS